MAGRIAPLRAGCPHALEAKHWVKRRKKQNDKPEASGKGKCPRETEHPAQHKTGYCHFSKIHYHGQNELAHESELGLEDPGAGLKYGFSWGEHAAHPLKRI